MMEDIVHVMEETCSCPSCDGGDIVLCWRRHCSCDGGDMFNGGDIVHVMEETSCDEETM